jgi:hypothetical protein
MFFYALNNLGYPNYETYFSQLSAIPLNNIISDYHLLEIKTFTSLNFEKFACQKGIENQNNYLNSSQSWRQQAEYYYNMSQDQQKSSIDRQNYYNMFKRLENQLRPEYIQKINDKLIRYQQKLALIKHLLKE